MCCLNRKLGWAGGCVCVCVGMCVVCGGGGGGGDEFDEVALDPLWEKVSIVSQMEEGGIR